MFGWRWTDENLDKTSFEYEKNRRRIKFEFGMVLEEQVVRSIVSDIKYTGFESFAEL